MITDDDFNNQITATIINLLENGVPTTIVANAFNIDTLTIKGLLADLRVKKYGSSEIAELLQGLMFEAYEEAVRSIRHGNPAVKSRMIALVLSKAMALVGKQAPEEFERMRREVLGLMSDTNSERAMESMFPDPEFSPSDTEDDE